ncbi:hypothetical protein D3C73_1231500 [compost metagenome]
MVSVYHDQTVVPEAVCFELFNKLSKGIIGIILGPDIITDKSTFITLRQLHLVFLCRNRKRMVGRHRNHLSVERLAVPFHFFELIGCFAVEHFIGCPEEEGILITEELMVIIMLPAQRAV